jgi:glycosyltransferase involved in cell wall biosynthesis
MNSLEREYPIIVHSHLGWDWVWQRPQQFMSRLSQRHAVLFIEGPLPDDKLDEARLEARPAADYPNVIVVRTRMPGAKWFDGDWVDNERRCLVQKLLVGALGASFQQPIQWFYDPMAVTAFAGHMNEQANVFDCMDQLSQFRGAPDVLVRRERHLLEIADIVFAGGPKLGAEKRKFNANTFVYGCGADADHFGKAMDPTIQLPVDIANLPKPVLGYFGVIDERMDYALLAELADAFATGSIVLIGPWTKVDPADFPQRPNLHYLDKRPYDQLPNYAAVFDVCLLPFALNSATEFVNPTKVLEYLATGKPVVSTAIADVMLQFSEFVKIAHSHTEFVKQCQNLCRCSDGAVRKLALEVARRNTWEQVVNNLERHIGDVLSSRTEASPSAAPSGQELPMIAG